MKSSWLNNIDKNPSKLAGLSAIISDLEIGLNDLEIIGGLYSLKQGRVRPQGHSYRTFTMKLFAPTNQQSVREMLKSALLENEIFETEISEKKRSYSFKENEKVYWVTIVQP